MLKTVEHYETPDGKTFADEGDALTHIADRCREVLDKRLEPLLGKFSANDLYQVVMAIAPNSDACESLAKQLAAITGVNGCD
jgi:hypothetical protein